MAGGDAGTSRNPGKARAGVPWNEGPPAASREEAGRGGPGPRAFRSHFVPRTRAGRVALAAFLALFAMTQPPVVHTLANRITPWVLGMPFLYAWLLGAYVLLIAVLMAALRRDL